MDCKALITTCLLVLDSGDRILEASVPTVLAHIRHLPSSLADLQSLKPLAAIQEKVDCLITHCSHLSQISLMLALNTEVAAQNLG